MTFKEAMKLLADGKRCTRPDWPEGHFIFLMPELAFRLVTDWRAASIELDSFVCFYGNNKYRPWSPADNERAAFDWVRV